ncbi:MAG: sigma-70 family RNA polymerase sigma factor [Pirellulales bacterium]
MSTTPQTRPMEELVKLAGERGREKELSDADLTDLIVHGRDRRALDILIRRYSPMVAGVCRAALPDRSSAEDAFQATFLVLMTSADRIRKQASIGAWLHGVAYRTACRLRNKRPRIAPESEMCDVPDSDAEEPLNELARRLDLEALDEEVVRLPEAERAVIVEHYMLGYTMPQIARRMKLTLAAVEGRIRRGRKRLRISLARRGIGLSVVTAASFWFQQQVQATDAGPWTDALLTQIGSGDLDSSLPDGFEPDISSLVKVEQTMLHYSLAKSLWVAGSALCIVATIAAAPQVFAQFGGGRPSVSQAQQSSDVGGVAAAGSTLPANPQAAGDAGSGDAGGAPPVSVATDEAIKTSQPGGKKDARAANPNGTPDPFASVPLGSDPFGGPEAKANSAKGSNPAAGASNKRAAADWVKPEEPAPNWLEGGDSQLEKFEEHRTRLQQLISLDYQETPLKQVLESLSENLGVPILLSPNFDEEQPITITVPEVSGREALRMILSPHGLSYVIRESSIEVDETQVIENDPTIRYYDLAFVVTDTGAAEQIIETIQRVIRSDMWESSGGTWTVSLVGSLLVVSASEDGHVKIEQLLARVAKVNKANLKGNVRIDRGQASGGGGGMGGGGMF